MKNHIIPALLVLAALGCAKKTQNASMPPQQQIGGLIGSFGHQTVGPSPYPTSWPNIWATAAVTNSQSGPVNQSLTLVVEVLDDFKQPVEGAQVRFYEALTNGSLIGSVQGLGTAPTDKFGIAWVSAYPQNTGTHEVRAIAQTTHKNSNIVVFTVTGQ